MICGGLNSDCSPSELFDDVKIPWVNQLSISNIDEPNGRIAKTGLPKSLARSRPRGQELSKTRHVLAGLDDMTTSLREMYFPLGNLAKEMVEYLVAWLVIAP